MKSNSIYTEPEHDLPLIDGCDVLVCGAGPAGIGAALAAARSGAKTTLLEVHGCLGGVWTAGLLSWVIDGHDKGGIMQEIMDRLDQRGARSLRVEGGKNFAYDIEQMKLLLDEMVLEAGIRVQTHTRVVAAARNTENRLAVVITESKSGRQAWTANTFIDATGDGDLAAQAGCGFDLGRPENGECQPMSLLALITGLQYQEISEFVGGGLSAPKARLLEELKRAGVSPSYAAPTLFRIHDDLFTFMGNHQYGVSALDARQITQATMRARVEIQEVITALKKLGGPWSNIRVVATAEQIGVREGRRIHGIYTVTRQDLIDGIRHEDGVCRANFGIDIHSTSPEHSKDYDLTNKTRTLPYDIPLRALISRDLDNLLMAGRCISGDFFSHASYRVTGNSVALGQAAGVTAALASQQGCAAREVNWSEVKQAIQRL